MMRGIEVTRAMLLAGATLLARSAGASPVPEPRALAGWMAYVDATEARIRGELDSPGGFLVSDFTADREDVRRQIAQGAVVVERMTTVGGDGREIGVSGATLQHWRGAVLLRGLRLEPLLDALQHPPPHGPFPPDVLTMRVEHQQADRFDLFMRISRTSIVSVTYDTENRVEYRYFGPKRVSCRSVATRITELEDVGSAAERPLPAVDDHGYLWRMNAYWRYEQTRDGVIVELESLTLSRSIPFAVRFAVDPIVNRLARESVDRTLRGIRDAYLPRLI
jgi:hypothetical protein